MNCARTYRKNDYKPTWRHAPGVVLGALSVFLSPVIALAQSSSPVNPEPVASVPPAVVDSVRIEGGAELTTDEKASLAEGLSGETVHSDWLEKLNANATARLQNDGFVQGSSTARVESTSIRDHKTHVTVVLSVTSGPRFLIGHIWWAGSSIFTPAQLDAIGLLRVGDVFRTSTISKSILLITQGYVEHGYRTADVTPFLQTYPGTVFGSADISLEIREGQKSGESQPLECKQYSAEDIQKTPYVPSVTYDPSADGQRQVARAELEARRTHKKVLIIAGFPACGWCRLLDQTFEKNPATTALRDKNFRGREFRCICGQRLRLRVETLPQGDGFSFRLRAR